MDEVLRTERLALRPWQLADAPAALGIYGTPDVTRWLTPAMDRVEDVEQMRSVLQTWQAYQQSRPEPCSHWAVTRRGTTEVVGGLAIQLLPPHFEDLEISWQVHPSSWRRGYAAEAAGALISWAFTKQIDELFAVTRPANKPAIATARRLGMHWVGETTKYYGLRLQVYRIRPNEAAPAGAGASTADSEATS